MRTIYAILCIIGTALPLAQFIPWLADRGLDLRLLVQEAVATPIAAFAWSDVLISAVVVTIFILVEGRRLAMRRLWVPLLGILVGPSLALPLFLLLREHHLAAAAPSGAHA